MTYGKHKGKQNKKFAMKAARSMGCDESQKCHILDAHVDYMLYGFDHTINALVFDEGLMGDVAVLNVDISLKKATGRSRFGHIGYFEQPTFKEDSDYTFVIS